MMEDHKMEDRNMFMEAQQQVAENRATEVFGRMAHASSPLELEIAIWYNMRSGDFGNGGRDNNFNYPGVQAALQRFVDAGLLKHNAPNADLPQEYVGTDGLRVFVETLCQIPWPVQQWVHPNQLRGISGTAFAGYGAARQQARSAA